MAPRGRARRISDLARARVAVVLRRRIRAIARRRRLRGNQMSDHAIDETQNRT